MAVKFTKEQQQAIDTLDKSVLVSAAAGSGKTAVLIERIIGIIIEGKADVDEMLVVTFTKAAAAEMRLKLARAIKKRMTEHPEDKKRLRTQMSRLYRAYISTIDSFAVRIIKEFFYETDVEPDFRACDDVQSTMLQQEAVDELFEESYGDPEFRAFLRLYSEERSDDRFKEGLIEAYSRLRTMPDYFAWAYEKAEDLNVTADNFEGSAVCAAMTRDALETLDAAAEAAEQVRELLLEAGLERLYNEKLLPEITEIETLRDEAAAGSMSRELIARMTGISFQTLRAKKAEEEAYAPIKETVKALRDAYKGALKGWSSRYILPDLDTRISEMHETYRYTLYYLGLLERFEEKYAAAKSERGLVDFADMEHMAVEILGRGAAAETLRRRFKYIFVDEYQDTNNIQEYLISQVARPDNVFRVGDVKQSIYRFRQAEPALFEKVYAEYSAAGGDESCVIDLNMNFRCNDRTIKYINAVFGEVMEGYDERARLYTGCSCPDEFDFIPEVHILCDESDEAEEPDDAEIIDLSKSEAEASYIAGIVGNLIGSEFYDTKAGVRRRVEAGDIAILMRATKVNGDIMARALRAAKIESHVEESEDYFDTVEIGVMLSLLSCIDNMKRDVQLIATLHSEVFGWSPAELAEIRTDRRREPYWEALSRYAEEGPDETVRAKAAYAIKQIKEWRTVSRMMPVADFIWKVLIDSGYYYMAGAMYGGAARQANLRTLVDRARKYSEDTVASLSSFIDFLTVMKGKKISNGQVQMVSKEDNVVRISTIHKSKGLEYPFVIVARMGASFRGDKLEKTLSFDSKLGIGLPYVDPGRKFWRSTMMQRAIHESSAAESYKEELRILYVAMTRARNKLILVGTVKNEETLMKYKPVPNSYFEVMKDVLKTPYNMYYIRPLERREKISGRTGIEDVLKAQKGELSPEAAAMYEEIGRRFSYVYPHADRLREKAKYSVSTLRKELLSAEAALEMPGADDAETDTELLPEGSELDNIVRRAGYRRRHAAAADIGIVYHRIMEYLDFAKAAESEAYIDECAQYLLDSGAIDEAAFRDVDMKNIYAFFSGNLGRRAAEASAKGTLQKEKPFTLRTEWQGREVLVQGVIDCLFEEDGKLVLVDYKSSFIRHGKKHAQEAERIKHEYAPQIELYKRAAEAGTGMKVTEAYLYLFLTGEAVPML